MKISNTTLRRLEKLEADAPGKVGNWVIGLGGNLIWDPWDFPEPSAEEAAASLERLVREIDQIAERMQGNYVPPTEKQKREAEYILDAVCERYAAERAAVRAFTAKVESERAATEARTENPPENRNSDR